MADVRRGADRVLVVVVTWNSRSRLPGLFESLPAGLAGVAARVLVVDNDSRDDTRAFARECGATVVTTGGNLGYGAAINAGYAIAEPDEHVLVLNPDVRLAPGSVAALLAELRTPDVGMVVPRIVDARGRTQPSIMRAPTVRRAWGEALLGGRRAARWPALSETVPAAGATGARDVDWASGAAVLVSARCRALLGNWDPTFFLYSEETEYMLRAAAHGLRVRYQPRAIVRHIGGDLHDTARLWQLQVRNRIGLFRRGHTFPASLAFQAGVVANELLRAPRSPVHRAGVRAAARPSTVPAGEISGLVAFAGVDWWYHNRAHSDVQLARHAARERPVVLVNSIGLRMPMPGRGSQPLRRIARKLASVARFVRTPLPEMPNFHVMTPVAVPTANPRLRELAAGFTRRQVQAVARWYLMGPPHVVVTIPSADRVVAGMTRASLTFNRSDLQSEYPEADQVAIAAMETRLLRDSDQVVYASHELMDHDRPLVGERARFLDHGVDADLFRPVPPRLQPADLRAIPQPRAGFFGGLDDYVVDFGLLEELARRLPEVQLVLIGDATCSLQRLTSLPNVHWLGKRPYESMPAYGSGFDVALMPWLDNTWIRFCNPIKVKEYLSLGLQVVSTPYPELARYRDVVRVARDRDEFVRHVAEALVLDPDSPQRRRRRVASDTWDRRARELLELLDGRTPATVQPR